MIPYKIRKKILHKLSQSALPGIPSEQKANQATSIGSPQSFIASNIYPSLTKGFSSGAVDIINKLTTYLNQSIFYASAGEYSMNKLYGLNFNFSPTLIPDANKDLKYLILFAKQVYNNLYNSGSTYSKALTKEEFDDKINSLLQSSYLNNLSQVNPTGQLSIKMGGNIKTDIINFLKLLLNMSPAK